MVPPLPPPVLVPPPTFPLPVSGNVTGGNNNEPKITLKNADKVPISEWNARPDSQRDPDDVKSIPNGYVMFEDGSITTQEQANNMIDLRTYSIREVDRDSSKWHVEPMRDNPNKFKI